MTKSLFTITKRVATTAPSIASNIAKESEKFVRVFMPTAQEKSVKDCSLDIIKTIFNTSYEQCSLLRKKNLFFLNNRDDYESLTLLADSIIETCEMRFLERSLRIKLSNTYVNTAKIKLETNGFLPFSEEKRDKDAQTIRLIKNMLEKATILNEDNKQAKSMLIEVEFKYSNLIEHNCSPISSSIRKE